MELVTLGVALGLFFGQQIGIMAIIAIGVFTRIYKLPKDVSWSQYYGLPITDIGFIMILFIGTLAFSDIKHQTVVRLGVTASSLLSGISGYLVLRVTSLNSIGRK